MMRLSNGILASMKWNKETKILSVKELILLLEDDFIKKGFTKYKAYIKEEIYEIIKKKKYKKMSIKQINWELSFDNLLHYNIIED